MKISEILTKNDDILEEYASGGSTGAGSIATVSSGLGGPMADVIRRMPAGQSFFGGSIQQQPIKRRRRLKVGNLKNRHK